MTKEELRELLPRIEAVASSAMAFIAEEREHFSLQRVEAKGKNDFVSYVDRGAEKIVLEGLESLLPSAGVISEEGGGSPREGGFNWIVDPLDGTTNFIHGMPPYAVSIGLARGEELLLGVVGEVTSKEIFSGALGCGATLNGKPIQSSSCVRVSDALIATGFPYREYDRMEQFMDTLDYFMRNSHGMRRLGSAATDLVYLACGRVDAFYEYGLHAWDVAAGLVIAREAGCKVCDFRGGGDVLWGGELIASAPFVFPELSAYLRRTMVRE